MSAGLQARLLRALQEKEVVPVGGGPVKTDIRVLSATNSDLRLRMEHGEFRSDLYYRIAGFVLRVPPLRERQGHVPQLVEDFLRRFAAESRKHVRGVTVGAMRRLVTYPWPGNVRELEHEVRRLVYVCPDGHTIDEAMLSGRMREGPEPAQNTAAPAPPPAADVELNLERRVAELERRLIEEALERTHGNRTAAARLLGISRNGLAIKIERFQAAKPTRA
jgi:two-component system response regulator HupR/HoxA